MTSICQKSIKTMRGNEHTHTFTLEMRTRTEGRKHERQTKITSRKYEWENKRIQSTRVGGRFFKILNNQCEKLIQEISVTLSFAILFELRIELKTNTLRYTFIHFKSNTVLQ